MLDDKAINKLAIDQQRRMWNEMERGNLDPPEFYSDPTESYIAAAIVNQLAHRHRIDTSKKSSKK